MTGTEIYKRSATYERDATTIRLHAPEWKLLLAFDGQRSLAEVALSVDVSFAEALPFTEKFLHHDWIKEQPITLDQYLKRTGAPDVSAIGSTVPPAIVLHAPKPESAPLPPPLAEKIAETPPAPNSSTTAKLSGYPMRLGLVINYLMSLATNHSLGYLLVYRIFLRVPPELLQAEDIASIHFSGESSLVRGEALKQAIANAVNEVTLRQLPDSVFAPA